MLIKHSAAPVALPLKDDGNLLIIIVITATIVLTFILLAVPLIMSNNAFLLPAIPKHAYCAILFIEFTPFIWALVAYYAVKALAILTQCH